MRLVFRNIIYLYTRLNEPYRALCTLFLQLQPLSFHTAAETLSRLLLPDHLHKATSCFLKVWRNGAGRTHSVISIDDSNYTILENFYMYNIHWISTVSTELMASDRTPTETYTNSALPFWCKEDLCGSIACFILSYSCCHELPIGEILRVQRMRLRNCSPCPLITTGYL